MMKIIRFKAERVVEVRQIAYFEMDIPAYITEETLKALSNDYFASVADNLRWDNTVLLTVTEPGKVTEKAQVEVELVERVPDTQVKQITATASEIDVFLKKEYT